MPKNFQKVYLIAWHVRTNLPHDHLDAGPLDSDYRKRIALKFDITICIDTISSYLEADCANLTL